jgi:predicted RNA-binding Zn ribbon-like protein
MVSRNHRFYWLANDRALDFLNTEPMADGRRIDQLPDFESLVAWCAEAGFIEADLARALVRRWGSTANGRAAVARAREFRASLRHLLAQQTRGEPPSARALSSLNRALALELGHTQLVRHERRVNRRQRVAVEHPEQLLRPIAEAAASLLCDADPALIRRCKSADCVLLFYDVSKNHARRWCSMELCGNRTKVAAHYRRSKTRRARPDTASEARGSLRRRA